MYMRKSILILSITCLLVHVQFSFSQSNIFSMHISPTYPGERKATVIVDLGQDKGTETDILLYYSTNKTDVERNISSSGSAQKQDLGNGKVKAEFVFPHKDFQKPNGNSDVNPKIYN